MAFVLQSTDQRFFRESLLTYWSLSGLGINAMFFLFPFWGYKHYSTRTSPVVITLVSRASPVLAFCIQKYCFSYKTWSSLGILTFSNQVRFHVCGYIVIHKRGAPHRLPRAGTYLSSGLTALLVTFFLKKQKSIKHLFFHSQMIFSWNALWHTSWTKRVTN